MEIVRSNLYGLINENMDQARSILKGAHIPEQDPRFQELKQMLLTDNKIGYIGKFTKWLFIDREPWAKILEVYNMLKTHPTVVPPIHTFDMLENLFDFLQGSEISTKAKKVINTISAHVKKYITTELKDLIELNIQYADAIADFYAKKGARYRDSGELYNDTKELIKNLAGKFNLEAIKNKIKKAKCNVEYCLENSDLLVIKVLDYKSSNELGSKSWCISYSENYWSSYADIFSTQYFLYDFTKSVDDKRSMIGVTINPDGSFKASHFKDDSVCPQDYVSKL